MKKLLFLLFLFMPAIAEAQKTCTPSSATSQNCIVTLTWQIIVDATHPMPTSVQVRRGDSGGPMAIIGTVNTPTASLQNTFTDVGNVAHCWDAVGLLAGLSSAPSPQECWTTPAIAPPAPVIPAGPLGLTISAISSSSFRITWSDVEGETGYELEGKRSQGSALFAKVATLPPDVVTYDWTGRTRYTPYCVRVKASNPGAPYSALSCATTAK